MSHNWKLHQPEWTESTMLLNSVKFIVLLLLIVAVVMAVPEETHARYKRQGHPSYYGRSKLSNTNANIGNRNGRTANNYNKYPVRYNFEWRYLWSFARKWLTREMFQIWKVVRLGKTSIRHAFDFSFKYFYQIVGGFVILLFFCIKWKFFK